MGLYADLLQQQFEHLPPVMQRLHGGQDTQWQGRVSVRRYGPVWLGWLLDRHGAPPAGIDLPCAVRLQVSPAGELWQRQMGAHRFHTRQRARGQLIEEYVAGLSLYFRLHVRGQRLLLRPVGGRWFGLPLPLACLPRGFGQERQHQGAHCFSVRLYLPLFGCVLAYRGRLQAVEEGGS